MFCGKSTETPWTKLGPLCAPPQNRGTASLSVAPYYCSYIVII